VTDPSLATLTYEEEPPSSSFKALTSSGRWVAHGATTGATGPERARTGATASSSLFSRSRALPETETSPTQICFLGAPGVARHRPPRTALGGATAVARSGVGETLWTRVPCPTLLFHTHRGHHQVAQRDSHRPQDTSQSLSVAVNQARQGRRRCSYVASKPGMVTETRKRR